MSDIIATDADIDPEIRLHLVEPFIAAATTALSEMAGAEAIVRNVRQQTNPPELNDITAVVEITATTTHGFLVLSFPKPTAAALAARILAGTAQKPDDNLIRDCVGEMTNVIAGQAKAMLAGGLYQFTFSIPKVLAGPSDFQPPQCPNCLVISFRSDQGEFALQLLRPVEAASNRQ